MPGWLTQAYRGYSTTSTWLSILLTLCHILHFGSHWLVLNHLFNNIHFSLLRSDLNDCLERGPTEAGHMSQQTMCLMHRA
jgi:hypothetical protein